MNRVRLSGGTAVITILSAEIEPIDAQRRSLKVLVRYTNTDRYPANFWSDSYRLIIDDVPRAPTNLLDEVVVGDSAKEGEVVFELPVSAKDVVLQVGARDDKARIPLALPLAASRRHSSRRRYRARATASGLMTLIGLPAA
jgi:hypothetical protein